MKILRNNGVMRNAPVNALRVENTNAFSFGVITTGPIRVYWGDGSYTDVGVNASWYTLNKTYANIGNWNIIITGVENMSGLNFSGATYCSKIVTNVLWFLQFTNLYRLTIYNATFIGDLSSIIDKLPKFVEIHLTMTIISQLEFNVSNCKSFWGRCLIVEIWDNLFKFFKGSLSDVNINLECKYLILYYCKLDGLINGIIKNGYTQLTYLSLYTVLIKVFPFTNIKDFIIPDTLISISHLGDSANYGDLSTFDFKNLQSFHISGVCSNADLSANTSFNAAVKANLQTIRISGVVNILKVNLSELTRVQYDNVYLLSNPGKNLTYGDITHIAKVTRYQICIAGGANDGSIYGTIDTDFSCNFLQLSYVDVTITADTLKYLATKSALILNNLPNLTGNISSCNFSYEYPNVGIVIAQMPNLYADISTFLFNNNYLNISYTEIGFYANPNFTGDLVNFPLFKNKYKISLNNCAYTNIPGFIKKVFANRNTCLKAAGGMTTISVQKNVDNNLLTGTIQQPPLGTYTGNVHDLTEQQIDYLAAGLDYTGTGTSTPWTDKELIWVMSMLKNSSADSSLRYRATWNV